MLATRFTLQPRGPYSLAASARFLEAFAPAAHEAGPEGHLHLALPGPQDEPAGVCLRQEEDGGAVLGEIFGANAGVRIAPGSRSCCARPSRRTRRRSPAGRAAERRPAYRYGARYRQASRSASSSSVRG